MRRIVWLAVLALLVLPLASFAQDDQMTWELNADTYVDIQDLGFRFYFPVGWTLDTSAGVAITENAEDIAPLIDDTGDTNPEGLAIRIIGLPLDQAPEGADTLDELVEELLVVTQLEETERTEVPVLGHRSISVFGNSTNNTRAGLLTVWLQPDYVVIAGFSAADMDTLIGNAYSWGATITSIVPLDTLPLGEEPVTAEAAGFTIRYPEGWVLNSDISVPGAQVIFENESDFDNLSTPEGFVFGVIESPIADLELEPEGALEGFAEIIKLSQGFGEDVEVHEDVILGQPALTYKGENSQNHYWGLVTVTIIGDTAVALVAAAPTEETITEFAPTWTSMLQSIRSTEATE